VGCLTVDNTPIPTDSTPMDSLDLSHVTVRSISNRQFSIPIKVETVENTEEITALINSGAKGLFIDKSIAHKWRTSILKSPIKVRNVDGTYNENGVKNSSQKDIFDHQNLHKHHHSSLWKRRM
jgi:hypothetical protein